MFRLRGIATVATVLFCAIPWLTVASTGGGTTITNAASATYSDAASHTYSVSSNPVSATVSQLGGLVVNPKQAAANPNSDGVAASFPATRTFTITNTSNITDAYQIDKITCGAMKVTSVSWETQNGPIATSVNGTVSPSVAPGGSIAVQVVMATSGIAVGTSIPVDLEAHTTVTTTANGIQTDSGQQWVIITTGPQLVGPGGPNTQIQKTVNQTQIVQSQPGNTVTFAIALMNSGGAPATNVVVTDPVPQPLAVILSSAQINGQPAGSQATLSGNTISFSIPTLGAGSQLVVSFNAQLPSGATIGTSYVNTASVSSNGMAPITTTPASVLTGTANIVYDGYAGESKPIGGAIVTLLDANNKPVVLSASTSQSKSAVERDASLGNTQNPYTTGTDGSYSFALSPSQISPNGSTFYITISANGYLNRRIELDLTPTEQNFFYNVKQTSLDGQPLAVAGGFALTEQNVNINNVFGLFGNLPMFTQRTIVVTKEVNEQAAAAGDSLKYTITFENQSQGVIGFTTILDTLPPGLVYLQHSAVFDGTPLDPTVNGRDLSWTLQALQPGVQHTITYGASIFPDVAVGTMLTNTVGVTGNIPGTTVNPGASATATVQVLDGPFTPRRIVTGRVFIDRDRSGHFSKGDVPLSNVRVYLEDGSYAITDAQGLFNFPSVRPGEHVLRIDPLTLPPTVKYDSAAPLNATNGTQRLLHGILDDTTMEDVQFALEPAS